jgi:tRNA (cmo5U34)-methyltransferase
MICEKFPDARITAIDLSLDCINECKKRIKSPNIEYINCDFRELTLPENHFDLVVSSISIHHINAIEKQLLFKKIFLSQTKGGIFSFCDQCKGETDFIYQKHISAWKEYAFAQGSSDEEWNMWMKHQAEHDYHDTIINHLLWLKNAGYGTVDCTKKHLLWTSFFAEK